MTSEVAENRTAARCGWKESTRLLLDMVKSHGRGLVGPQGTNGFALALREAGGRVRDMTPDGRNLHTPTSLVSLKLLRKWLFEVKEAVNGTECPLLWGVREGEMMEFGVGVLASPDDADGDVVVIEMEVSDAE